MKTSFYKIFISKSPSDNLEYFTFNITENQ